MKQRLLATLLVVSLALAALPAGVSAGAATDASGAQVECSFPFSSTDATGTEVTVEQEPQRVTVLAPSAAQTMWEIGAKEKVVGAPVNQYTTYLQGIESRTNVAAASAQDWVDTEKVVNTTPDLVLAPNVIPNQTVEKLRDAGLTVYKFEKAESLESIYEKTLLTGQLVGACDGAEETVAWMKDRISTVREAVEGEEEPSVFFSLGAGWTAGQDTFIDHAIETAGGDNIADEVSNQSYFKISNEVIIQQNPHWIVENGEYGDYPKNEAFNSTYAVKNGQVFQVNSNYMSQPAPRVVYPIVTMAKHFHPEAWKQANATTTTTTTTTTTEQTTTTTATTNGESPGFGVTAALVALLGAALLARRQ